MGPRKWDRASKLVCAVPLARTRSLPDLITGLPHATHLPPRRPPRAAPHRPRHQRRARRPRLRRAHARALQRWRRCSAGDGPRRVPRGRVQCRGQAERHAALRAVSKAVGAGRRRRRWRRPALGRRRRHHHTRVGSDRAEPDPRTGKASTRPSLSAFAVGLRRRPSASAERRSNAAQLRGVSPSPSLEAESAVEAVGAHEYLICPSRVDRVRATGSRCRPSPHAAPPGALHCSSAQDDRSQLRGQQQRTRRARGRQ